MAYPSPIPSLTITTDISQASSPRRTVEASTSLQHSLIFITTAWELIFGLQRIITHHFPPAKATHAAKPVFRDTGLYDESKNPPTSSPDTRGDGGRYHLLCAGYCSVFGRDVRDSWMVMGGLRVGGSDMACFNGFY